MSESKLEDYSSSHASPGYGRHYEKTYQHGYYYEQWRQIERPILRRVLAEIAATGASSCLDFACGTGRILEVAEEFFSTTYGVDISDTMLEIARERCRRSTILNRDIIDSPLGETFDVVTSFRFFLNAEETLRASALGRLHEQLAPGGYLVANIHVNTQSILGRMYEARNRVSGEVKANTMGWPQFRDLLSGHGFEAQNVEFYSFLPRTGPWLDWIPRLMITPVERACRRLPLVRDEWAQSFLVVARKV